MSYKPVTVSQMECGRKIANEKKVGSRNFQRSIDDGRFAAFLEGLKNPIPPAGCRMHILRATVILDQPWNEAVNAAGPDTPANYNVRKVGDLYIPTGAGAKEEEYILLNYPDGTGNWDKALVWARQEELKQTVPREAFAIGKENPTLHNTLGLNPMYVVATTECTFEDGRRACDVWWGDAEREADLDWVGLFDGQDGWFLFRKEPSVSKPKF